MENKFIKNVEIAGENYILDVEGAKNAGVLKLDRKYYDGQFFKYNSSVMILLRDQGLNFNLYNLSCNYWFSTKWYSANQTYLNHSDLVKIVSESDITPLDAIKITPL